jgi:hypothetical protein
MHAGVFALEFDHQGDPRFAPGNHALMPRPAGTGDDRLK